MSTKDSRHPLLAAAEDHKLSVAQVNDLAHKMAHDGMEDLQHLLDTVKGDVRTSLKAGIQFEIPLAITFYIVSLLLGALDSAFGFAGGALVNLLPASLHIGIMQTFADVLVFVLLTVVLGTMRQWGPTSKILEGLRWLLLHIPVIGAVLKAITKFTGGGGSGGHAGPSEGSTPVLLEFCSQPRIGFVIGEVLMNDVQHLNALIYPMPPTSVNLMHPAASDVQVLRGWTPGQAWAAVLSGGGAMPASLNLDAWGTTGTTTA